MKAVEENNKREEARKAKFEDGELTDSSKSSGGTEGILCPRLGAE